MLVPFLEDHVLILILFFKIKVGRAALVDDSLHMLAISIVDVVGYHCKDGIGISAFPDVFPLEVADHQSCIESMMDGAGGY